MAPAEHDNRPGRGVVCHRRFGPRRRPVLSPLNLRPGRAVPGPRRTRRLRAPAAQATTEENQLAAARVVRSFCPHEVRSCRTELCPVVSIPRPGLGNGSQCHDAAHLCGVAHPSEVVGRRGPQQPVRAVPGPGVPEEQSDMVGVWKLGKTTHENDLAPCFVVRDVRALSRWWADSRMQLQPSSRLPGPSLGREAALSLEIVADMRDACRSNQQDLAAGRVVSHGRPIETRSGSRSHGCRRCRRLDFGRWARCGSPGRRVDGGRAARRRTAGGQEQQPACENSKVAHAFRNVGSARRLRGRLSS